MASTSYRTLRLLSLLQNHRYWAGSELAVRLGVSIRTVRRDVDRLRDLGYPVVANRGVDGGYQLEAGAALPPLSLDDEEAVALAVALQTAAHESVPGIAESALGALAKLTRVMPPRLRRRVDAVRNATEVPRWSPATAMAPFDPAALVVVALACRDGERLRFGYVSSSEVRTDRQVEPVRLVAMDRRWYLVAYDIDRHDWRSFRLDRIKEPRPDGQRFRARELPTPDAVSLVREGIGRLRSLYDVEVVISAPQDIVSRRLGRWGTITPLDELTCQVSMRAESLDWPAMALGSLGAPFQVIRPPELIDLLRNWAGLFTAATTTAQTHPG